jgi:hypothetical protein
VCLFFDSTIGASSALMHNYLFGMKSHVIVNRLFLLFIADFFEDERDDKSNMYGKNKAS